MYRIGGIKMHNFKSFENFKEGIAEIRKIIPVIDYYIGEEDSPAGIITELTKKILSNFPSVKNPEYPNTLAISVNANEVGFKTSGFYSFGWRTEVDNVTGKFKFNFRVTLWGKNSVLNENLFKTEGWSQVPETRRQEAVKKSVKQKKPKVKPEESSK